MSTLEKDKWDTMAKELLPCNLDCRATNFAGTVVCHSAGCLYTHRPSVAAKLREMAAEIEALRAFVGDEMARSDYKSVAEMRAEIEKLKAELADLESVKTKTDAMLQMALGDREALRSKLRAEAIHAAQARESE